MLLKTLVISRSVMETVIIALLMKGLYGHVNPICPLCMPTGDLERCSIHSAELSYMQP